MAFGGTACRTLLPVTLRDVSGGDTPVAQQNSRLRVVMLEIIVGRNRKNMLAQQALIATLKDEDLSGTLYLGYPILASADQMVTISGLLTTREFGLVAIDFSEGNFSLEEVRERQDEAYNAVFRKLFSFRPLVVKRK